MAVQRAWLLALIGLVLAAPFTVALASGGGMSGGGEMPSATAPQYDPSKEYAEGMSAYQGGRFKDAARSFEHVTIVAPDTTVAWRMLAMSRRGASDLKGAAKAYDKALKLDPSPVDLRRDYALVLADLKMPDKAQSQLAKLKVSAAACAETCPTAAALKSAIDQVESALQGAAAPKPSAALSPPAVAVGGDAAYLEAVADINDRRWLDALAALDRAEAVLGPHPDILTYRGYVNRRLGHLDRAERFYRAALSIAPEHRGATEYYGELKVIEGDLPAARALLAKIDRQCAFGCAEAEELRRWIDSGHDPAS